MDMLLLAMLGRVRASNAISQDTGVLGGNRVFGFCQSSGSILTMFNYWD
jgi:hypothetical protein